jgi:hypothetical protein
MKEIWKCIDNYDCDYKVSSHGRLISYKQNKERLIKGHICKTTGYLVYTLMNENGHKSFYSHQLVAIVFLNHKMDGHAKVVDHINGNKTDNRLENLRIISQQENLWNTKNTKGYTYMKKEKMYMARIVVDYKLIYLGRYKNEIDARNAYLEAKKKYHKI